jgi:hypothetical protein
VNRIEGRAFRFDRTPTFRLAKRNRLTLSNNGKLLPVYLQLLDREEGLRHHAWSIGKIRYR